ncbi:MAG: hypothetical protein WA632_10070 [Gallionella sp.]
MSRRDDDLMFYIEMGRSLTLDEYESPGNIVFWRAGGGCERDLDAREL